MQTIKCPYCKREFDVRSEAIIVQCKCGETFEGNNYGERNTRN